MTLGSVIIQLRVSCKSDQEWIKLSRLSNEVTIPWSPHTISCVMGRSSHRQSWASAWVQGQLASLDLSCTRSGSRYQLRAELTANHHSQASGALWPQGACDTFISTVSSQGRGAGRAGMKGLLRSPPMSCVSQCSHDVMKPLDGVMTQIPQLWGNDFRHGRPGSVQHWRKHDSANKMVQFSFQYRDYIKL